MECASTRAKFSTRHVILQRVRKPVAARPDGFVVVVSPGQALPTPLVVNNRVYVGGGFGSHELCCLDAGNGNVIWTAQLSDNGPGPAAYYDGAIYVNTESCTLFSLSAVTGQPLWSWWLGDPLPTMPAVANGRVFTAYPGGGAGPLPDGNRRVLACLDAKTGRPIWLRWIDSEILSAPVADKDDVYVATFGGVLYRFRQSDGTVLLAVKSRPTSAPVLVDKYVLYSRVRGNSDSETVVGHANSNSELLLETVQSGRRAWPLDGNANSAYVYQGSRPLVWGGRMLVSLGKEVHCLSLVHGMPYWSRKVGQALPPVAAGKAVIVATEQGEILRLDIGTGEVLAKHELRERVSFPPVVHSGNIYVGTARGNLTVSRPGTGG